MLDHDTVQTVRRDLEREPSAGEFSVNFNANFNRTYTTTAILASRDLRRNQT